MVIIATDFGSEPFFSKEILSNSLGKFLLGESIILDVLFQLQRKESVTLKINRKMIAPNIL